MHLTVSRHPRRGADGRGRREGSLRGGHAGRASCSPMRKSRRSSPSRISIVAEIGKPKKAVAPLVSCRATTSRPPCANTRYDKVRMGVRNLRPSASASSVRRRSRQRSPEHFRGAVRGPRESKIGDALYCREQGSHAHATSSSKGIRPDGRKLTEVRPIWCEVGVLPRAHGSGVFTRGQTQVTDRRPRSPLPCEESDASTASAPRTVQALYAPLQLAAGYSTGEAEPSEAARAAARSVTARWRSARCSPMIPSESKSSPTALRLVSEVHVLQRLHVSWPPSAAPRWR